MMYEIFRQANFIFYIMLAFSGLLIGYRFIYHFYGLFATRKYPCAKANHKYAIIIPARYESSVIEETLISIQKQDYPAHLIRTFVIVESPEDPTCEICSRYNNVEVFMRPDLKVKTKGGALKQFFSAMSKNKHGFDAYFIFDADSVLSSSYIKEMNKCFDGGYKMALGFRNSKNWNGGWVAACSSALYIGFNTNHNKFRSRFFKTSVITGTGFYIAHEIIENIGGWTFETFTEDLEISLFAALNNINIAYNEKAEFFDEQPHTLRISRKQHVRWLRGYHQIAPLRRKVMKNAVKERNIGKLEMSVSIAPVLMSVISIALYIVFAVGFGLVAYINGFEGYYIAFRAVFIVLMCVYLFFVVYFFAVILGELRCINIKFWNAVRASFMNPIFFSLFIPCYFIYIFKKDVEWKPIERTVSID